VIRFYIPALGIILRVKNISDKIIKKASNKQVLLEIITLKIEVLHQIFFLFYTSSHENFLSL